MSVEGGKIVCPSSSKGGKETMEKGENDPHMVLINYKISFVEYSHYIQNYHTHASSVPFSFCLPVRVHYW